MGRGVLTAAGVLLGAFVDGEGVVVRPVVPPVLPPVVPPLPPAGVPPLVL